MQELKAARKKLDEKLGSGAKNSDGKTTAQHKQENKFVRVAIQEEDDEEEETEKKEPSFQVSTAAPTDTAEEPKPKVEVVQSKDNESWWKQSSDTMSYDDLKPSKPNGDSKKPTDKFHRVQIEEDDEEEASATQV